MKAAVDSLKFSGKTAMGDGLALGHRRRAHAGDRSRHRPAAAAAGRDRAAVRRREHASARTRSRSPSARSKLKIPVYTVALGTQSGYLEHTAKDGTVTREPVPPDTETLQEIARATRRALLPGRRRAAADRHLPQPRHALLDQEGEAGGHGGVRRRRARAAAGRDGRGDGARRAAAVRARCPTVERTPDRPGPGPVPPAVLRSLDLAVLRRVESLVPGEHLTPQVGAGTELAMIRPYFPGDDVRHIDWNVTARMREPHVRVHVGERALTTWLVLDTSASMTFGTADRRKFDVAEGVALAVGHVASRRGNRLGVVSFGGGSAEGHAPAPGPAGSAAAAGRAARRARGRGRRRHRRSARAVTGVAAVARARGLIVVVSDFRGDRDWEGVAAQPARAPRHAGRRDPRPARAGAHADGRPVARRSRDRPPAAGQHEPPQRPQALRRGGRRRARRGRGRAAPRERRPPGPVDQR